jgi:hypothetical protein
MSFDPEAVPESARQLIALAEVWAIGDDYDREAAVERATDQELRRLVDGVAAADGDFWDWLAGPESNSSEPSPEYIAMTHLSMAADSARVRLSRRQTG